MMESHIIEMAKTGSIYKVSNLLRITDTQMWRIIHYHVNKCRKNADFSTLTNLGIDETSKKGHHYITNFVDLDKKKIMYVALGKDAKTVGEFALDLEAHGGCSENVTNVTSDMSLAFESGIANEFVNSSLIIDKFHVIKHFNDAVNQTLRVDIAAGYDFKKSKYIWMKNYENLTEKQSERMMRMNQVYSKTGRAYQMKVMMQEIYKLTVKGDAKGALDKLISWMKRSRNEYMIKVANMLVNHYDSILNYFDNRLTNAVLEGLNNVVQSIKHVARGFRNNEYFRCMVYLHCGAFDVKV
jgi:transposase